VIHFGDHQHPMTHAKLGNAVPVSALKRRVGTEQHGAETFTARSFEGGVEVLDYPDREWVQGDPDRAGRGLVSGAERLHLG